MPAEPHPFQAVVDSTLRDHDQFRPLATQPPQTLGVPSERLLDLAPGTLPWPALVRRMDMETDAAVRQGPQSRRQAGPEGHRGGHLVTAFDGGEWPCGSRAPRNLPMEPRSSRSQRQSAYSCHRLPTVRTGPCRPGPRPTRRHSDPAGLEDPRRPAPGPRGARRPASIQ